MKYYVYTPADGNEDGAFAGLSLEDAKDLARRTAANLRAAGLSAEKSVALVNTLDGDRITVWSCDGGGR